MVVGNMDYWANNCVDSAQRSLRWASGNVFRKGFTDTPSCNNRYMFGEFSFS
jgi:hypothetical protein